MGIFVCDKCECVDNTACGLYWTKDMKNMFPEPYVLGTALCTECAPTHFTDGSASGYGVWHGHFSKVKWDGKREVMNREVSNVKGQKKE